MTPNTASPSVFPYTWGTPQVSRIIVTFRASCSNAATSFCAFSGAQAVHSGTRMRTRRSFILSQYNSHGIEKILFCMCALWSCEKKRRNVWERHIPLLASPQGGEGCVMKKISQSDRSRRRGEGGAGARQSLRVRSGG